MLKVVISKDQIKNLTDENGNVSVVIDQVEAYTTNDAGKKVSAATIEIK